MKILKFNKVVISNLVNIHMIQGGSNNNGETGTVQEEKNSNKSVPTTPTTPTTPTVG
ncbi:hypothetical protein ACJD0Z_17505 [Flavobacteriaceae bacterium M23B6Z8]